MSLRLGEALFEEGRDIGLDDELVRIADAAGLAPPPYELDTVLEEWHDGQRRGVIGSLHFFVGDDGFFCPTLRIEHGGRQFHTAYEDAALEDFLERLDPAT